MRASRAAQNGRDMPATRGEIDTARSINHSPARMSQRELPHSLVVVVFVVVVDKELGVASGAQNLLTERPGTAFKVQDSRVYGLI